MAVIPEIPIVAPQADTDPERAQKERAQLREVAKHWGTEHAARVQAIADELIDDAAGSPATEQTLLRLAAGVTAVAEQLQRCQLQMAERLERLVDSPKLLAAVAKAMVDTTRVHTATTRSAAELFQAAGILQTQRRLTDRRGSEGWHADVGTTRFGRVGRDSSQRPTTTN